MKPDAKFWNTVWLLIGLALVIGFIAVCFMGCVVPAHAQAFPPNPYDVASPVRAKSIMLLESPQTDGPVVAPCLPLNPGWHWPFANPNLTNSVTFEWQIRNEGDWQTIQLHWFVEANVLYQMQFSTNLHEHWFVYSETLSSTNRDNNFDWFPVFCGQTRFVRVMR